MRVRDFREAHVSRAEFMQLHKQVQEMASFGRRVSARTGALCFESFVFS